jgi:hypothetical protein
MTSNLCPELERGQGAAHCIEQRPFCDPNRIHRVINPTYFEPKPRTLTGTMFSRGVEVVPLLLKLQSERCSPGEHHQGS